MTNKMNNSVHAKKPFQILAWISTFSILSGAILASFVPELYYHHYFFLFGNSLLAITAFLWREYSLLVLNSGLSLIYIFGIFYEFI